MTTSVTQVLSGTQITADVRPANCQTLTNRARREIERLTQDLFFNASGLHRRSILMVDLGDARTSSLWLATGVASVLSKSLRQPVHVLSVGSRPADFLTAWDNIEPNAADENCILEPIGDASSRSDHARELAKRVPALRARDGCVIAHLSQTDEPIGTIVRTIPVDGVVLLVRAGRTRRAAVTAAERQLTAAGSLLLGSVLLDRVYPIPEKLYRLL